LLGAVVAVVGYSVVNPLAAFVGPSPTSTAYHCHLRRSVALAAISKDDVQQAEKDAKLAAWAAQKLASEGAPQAAVMQAKADKAMQTLEALKQQFLEQEDGRPAVPVAAPMVPAPAVATRITAAAPGEISKDDVEKAKNDARLFTWAAQKLASEGAPQMAMMQAKAERAAQALEALTRQFQVQEAASKPGMAAAAPPTLAVPSAAVSSAPSAEEVAAAKRTADLQAWALKTLVAKGAPEAAAMQAKAAESAQRYEALKDAYELVSA